MFIGDFVPVTPSGGLMTSWMPRGGDSAVFAFETIAATGVTLTIKVFHKDSEDQGPGSVAGSITTAVGSSRYTEEVITDLKEMVRYNILCQDASGGSGAVYRILEPNWFNAARGEL